MTDRETILPVLKKIPIFATLDGGMHARIVEKITLRFFPKDQVIFHGGDSGDAMYIIKNGSVIVYHEPKEIGLPEEVISTLKDNDFFGEMALVSNDKRNASVRVLSDSDIFVLDRLDFDTLIAENPETANKISTTYFERFKANNK